MGVPNNPLGECIVYTLSFIQKWTMVNIFGQFVNPVLFNIN